MKLPERYFRRKPGNRGAEAGRHPSAEARAADSATMKGAVRKVQGNYHVPISNTASGLMALEAV